MVKVLLLVVQLLVVVNCRVKSESSLDGDSEEHGYRHGSNQNWEKDEISVENEIARPQSFGLGVKPHKLPPLQDYACGRSMADKRMKGQLSNEQQQVSRNKYRPTEIRMPRIIGGDETAPGEFPWTVSVKLNGQPICGGSLIDHSWILTAAHCVVGYNPKNLTIRLGAYRIKDISETQTVDLPVSMFIVHKEYSMPRPFSNDIAMLKLSESVEFSDYIIPICLPREDRPFPATISQLTTDSNSGHAGNTINSDDVGGIVVSTKMSDLDIAKCFNRLEQNYLNSIGLGTSLAPSLGEPDKATTPRPSPQVSTSPPTRLGSYGNLLDPIFMEVGDSPTSLLRKPINNNMNQLQFPLDQQILSTASLESSPASNYVYYNLMHQQQPWRAKVATQKRSRDNTIRLSRLPISKELLREIQSVGSGPMQTLGLQQGDFVAMTNDLNQVILASSPPPPQIASPQQQQQNQPQEREKIRNLQAPVRSLESSIEGDENDLGKYSTGMSGIVVGWGWVRELDGDDQVNKGFPSVTLQKVKLPILRNNVCEAWFQSQAKKITLLPSQFCAGFNSGGKDACRGDSGGPMIIEDTSNTGRYTLIGIVSAGIGCARPSLPGLYTRVASFLPWIHAQILRY